MSKSRILFIALLLGLLLLWFFGSRYAREHAPVQIERPNNPWVFRSVLDTMPRMITFALHERLWVAYSTDSCALYKAWDGSVNFEGAVFNMRHGPQPTTRGNAWYLNHYRQPWTVTLDGRTEYPRTDYKGHRYTKRGQAEIFYDLVLSDGRRIRINERPEFFEENRQIGFERLFTMQNAPEGAQVTLRFNAGSIVSAANIETDGVWKTNSTREMTATTSAGAVPIQAVEVDGELTLRANKTTRLLTRFVSQAQYPNLNDTRGGEETAEISPGERLMAKSDCRICHNPKVPTVGPSYTAIAERYLNTPENIDKLAAKVIAGGAGVWGVAAMSAHPDLQPDDAKAMVSYVLSLDEGDDDGESGSAAAAADLSAIPENAWFNAEEGVELRDLGPGLLIEGHQLAQAPNSLTQINFNQKASFTALAGVVNVGPVEFGAAFKNNFAWRFSGYLFLEKDDDIVFQLASDDGARFYLDDRLLVDNDGLHGMDPKNGEAPLRAGYHRVRIDYFQSGGGRGVLLKWARGGSREFVVVPESNFSHKRLADEKGLVKVTGDQTGIPGDGIPLAEVHPAYTLSQARPDEFLPKVAGMDFLSDGRLVISTWDAMGGVYILDNVQSGDPKKIRVKQIARGLAEPLGLKVVDDTIYVLQKQELTQLVDADGDDVIDEYRCFAKGWRASANFHEFAFGLVYKDDHFYATLAIAILPGGASARPQIPDRGKVVKISRRDGSIEFVARGLRTPNGIGIGVDGEIFVADNQGDWLPSSKIVHVKPGAFFGSYAVDSVAVAGMPVQQPVVWLPQDEIGNSPSTPGYLNDGPYKGQMIHGEVTHGGVKRVFVEKVNGDYQGCVFRFIQGLEAGVNRLVWGPDGALYVGGVGNPGNWGHQGKLWYGLQRLKYNGTPVFEMLAVRAKSNGMEIEFTEPLREGDGWDPAHYLVQQWRYLPTPNYGGPKLDEETLPVVSASVSEDRKRVFLEIPGLKPGHVVYLRLRNLPVSDLSHEIWTTEAWYTLNSIPADEPGTALARPTFEQPADNTLTEKEKAAGWQLLFDGNSLRGWHNFGKSTIGASWIIDNGAIHLDARPNPEGHWQAPDGGDILSADEYQDFELTLQWKIGPCGNSGIIYNVVEDPSKYQYAWQTGPEMQVLDNSCHPDSRFPKHRAGDLYDLISCKYETVKPAGEWNLVRIVSKNGRVEHWLNNRKVVEFQMFDDNWWKLIAGSKFKDMPGFGRSPKGRIMLQDHGDPVWYKNIKIRKL